MGQIDVSELVYDSDRQITLVRDIASGSLMPWSKHSTGTTTTNSNTDGHGGNEQDEDHTED